jgi:choline-sulfatase
MAIRDFASTEHARRLIARGATEVTTLDRALRWPDGVGEQAFFDHHCPPLPDNHAPQRDEPGAIQWVLEQRPFKKMARERYTERQWRLHRWAYCRLTEMVDAQIGRVLDALRASGQERETVVVFSSDHGDHDSAHKLEHKTIFYEEACRVPLIVSQPGVTPPGVCPHPVSNGLDLLPTLCDYAGVDPPPGLSGFSLRPLAEGTQSRVPRSLIPVESEIGRMVIVGDYKYMRYDGGANREQLIDLRNDPGETRNALSSPESGPELATERRDALLTCRTLFERHFGEEGAA